MPQTYADYLKRANERKDRQSKSTEGKTFPKIGFLKLPKDGDVALVRINVTKAEDLMLTDYHQLDASTKYMKVECTGAGCPFCAEAERQAKAKEATTVSKAKARVFVPMVVAYRQPDGSYSEPAPVIMDASAAGKSDFVKPLVDKLVDFGPLDKHVLKLTRRGEKLETTYALDYVPTFDNDSIIPTDMSAFNNFRIDKHSYWVKTNEEINTFLATGQFPQAATATTASATSTVDATDAMAKAEENPYTAPAPETATYATPGTTAPETKATETETPKRNPNFQAHW